MKSQARQVPSGTRISDLRFGNVDHTLPFIPEAVTHLPYTNVYSELSTEHRLRYNQLFGLYVNELAILFEEGFAPFYQHLADARLVEATSAPAVRQFVCEEAEHAAMFRRLNQAAAPELYQRSPFYFLRPPGPRLSRVLVLLGKCFAPAMVLLCTIQEERVTRYGDLYRRDEIEPNFFAATEAHCNEECDHIVLGPLLIERLWSKSSRVGRALNGYVFRFLMREFFLAPKRGGVRILNRLVEEFPELRPLSGRLRGELLELQRNKRFLRALYSRDVIPQSIALLEKNNVLRSAALALPELASS
ncbi:MAG: diiron oxygenase [Bdellovibrionota bacterium]